jgi:regulatory protein YycH of two-component signal transduction system YycFG
MLFIKKSMTIINGIEYLTNVIPGNVPVATYQQEYLMEYSLAYHSFLKDICLPFDNLSDSKSIYIDCKNNDTITSSYYLKFKKSKFMSPTKIMKLKNDLYKYYNPQGFSVKGPYEVQNNIYCIELLRNLQELKDSKCLD